MAKNSFNLLKTALIAGLLFCFSLQIFASEGTGEKYNPGADIIHHIKDDYSWHLFTAGEFHAEIPLPVILYSKASGLDVFMSSNFHHGTQPYNGYELDHGKLSRTDGASFYDFSITKNVLALIVNALILVLVFLSVAKSYTRNKGKAPTGIQSFVEPIIVFIQDEIAKPNIGPKYARYMPYLLTLFFFILIGNLVGLMPGAANMTGNIAVTCVMALITLALTLGSANKNYWGHIFNPPGVPLALKPIIVPVEIIGIFTKPFSLMVRLFVAITAGHIVILSLISLTFIFHSWSVGVVSSLIVLFINIIELLVAAIQAYVFTLFSALYIGMAVEEHH